MEDKVNSLKCEKTAQKGKITRLETYVQSITEPICEEKLPESHVKFENVKNIMKSVEELSKEYFKLPASMDISDAETDLEDMEARLEKIEVRLKTFLHKLNIKFQVNNSNSEKEQG